MVQFKAYGQAILKTHLKITKVVDGDGIFVMNIFNKLEEEIRFLGIDAPEIRRSKKLQQDERETHLPGQLLLLLGHKSKTFLNTIAPVGTSVTIRMEKLNGIDPYGRTLAYVFLADGRCLNEIMISEGYAKPFSKYYCQALPLYQQLYAVAKSQRKGLFVNNFSYEF